MQLKKIIDQVWEEIEDFGISDDTPLDYEYLRDIAIGCNITLMGQSIERNESLDSYYFITSCNQVECYEVSCTIEGITFNATGDLWVIDLPPLVKDIGWKNIRYLGVAMLEKGLTRKTIEGFMSNIGNRYSSDYPIYTVIGDKAIIKNGPTKGFTFATLVGVLTDVTQADDWPDNDEAEFPTPSVVKLKMLMKKNIMAGKTRPDLIHDAQRAMPMAEGQQQQREQPKQEK